MELSFFNINDGFPEAIVRGLRSGFLTADDYRRLSAAETLEDVRTTLDDTEYAQFLQDEPSPLLVQTIVAHAKQRVADEFRYIRAQSVDPLVKFLDFITYGKMIDNVISLIQGTINKKPAAELLAKVDPLGWFEEMKTIPNMDISGGYDDIYKTILIETPVGPYFEEFLKCMGTEEGKSMSDVSNIFSEMDLELMKQVLKKAWLEDFYEFVQQIGGTTEEVMGHILKLEADARVLLVTLNTLNTPLGSEQQRQDRNALYPHFGYLYPEGTDKIRKAWNEQTVSAALEPYDRYKNLFEQVKVYYSDEKKGDRFTGSIKSLEDILYIEQAKMYELTFEQQYHYGIFYAWAKLREQEIRNIEWICNMVVMGNKQHMDDIVTIFAPRV